MVLPRELCRLAMQQRLQIQAPSRQLEHRSTTTRKLMYVSILQDISWRCGFFVTFGIRGHEFVMYVHVFALLYRVFTLDRLGATNCSPQCLETLNYFISMEKSYMGDSSCIHSKEGTIDCSLVYVIFSEGEA